MGMIRVGICGFGYWGPTLLRAFSINPAFQVTAIADTGADQQAKARELKPGASIYADGMEMTRSPDVDAVAIATPVSTHCSLTLDALKRGKHVLVEKPMCASAEEGREMVAVAERMRGVLMVDHTYLFNSAVRKLKELKINGALGKITYYDSLRVNLGLFQSDVNVLWDLAPHDYSIMDYILEEQPVDVEASGYCHVNSHLPDIAYITLHYPSHIIAHLNLSWISPVKARRVALGGTAQMVIWDDLNPDEKLKVYNSGIEFHSQDERRVLIPGYRIGDISSPRLPEREPLAAAVDHFRQVIVGTEQVIADGHFGLRVIELLERTQRALDASLGRVNRLRAPEMALQAAQ
jgi:predicted dehydrogenase